MKDLETMTGSPNQDRTAESQTTRAAELAEYFETATDVDVRAINRNRVFPSEPGWLTYRLSKEEIALIAEALKALSASSNLTVTEGSRVTTRYFGGYEAVDVRQIHPTYFVVARFGGAAKNLDGGEATDILPRDQVEKITRLGPRGLSTDGADK